MRKDPPFDMEYIYATYLLELAEAAGVLVVNAPQGLRDANEKLFTAWFRQCCPESLVTRGRTRISKLLNNHAREGGRPGFCCLIWTPTYAVMIRWYRFIYELLPADIRPIVTRPSAVMLSLSWRRVSAD